MASQASLSPAWKQEVNQRLAAHKTRRSALTSQLNGPSRPRPATTGALETNATSNLAAEAAARVAARYAKAPSYSEMLAAEARAAVRAAEAASRAALEAQAAAESVLAGLEAEAAEGPPWQHDGFQSETQEWAHRPGPEPQADSESANPARRLIAQLAVEERTPNRTHSLSDCAQKPSYAIRWDEDLPVRHPAQAPIRAMRGRDAVETSLENLENSDNWWETGAPQREAHGVLVGGEAFKVVEPAQPLHANLIEFPRELVAARKVRPRLAEGPYASPGDSVQQLSIFEVDPATVSTVPSASVGLVPDAASARFESVRTGSSRSGHDWAGSGSIAPDSTRPGSIRLDSIRLDSIRTDSSRLGLSKPGWSGIELDAQPLPLSEAESALDLAIPALDPAPMSLRLMAALVDGALTAGAFLAASLVVMKNISQLPSFKLIEIGAALALLAIAVVYQVFFLTLTEATPGMKWAGISLCTFSDEIPIRAQRRGRLVAMLLSLLPLGLGVVWSIFDEDHLSWHDRLSATYLRKG